MIFLYLYAMFLADSVYSIDLCFYSPSRMILKVLARQSRRPVELPRVPHRIPSSAVYVSRRVMPEKRPAMRSSMPEKVALERERLHERRNKK